MIETPTGAARQISKRRSGHRAATPLNTMSGRRRRVGESDEDNDDYVEIEEGDEVIERMPGTQLPGNGEGPSQTQAEKSQEQDSQTQRPKKKQKRASDGWVTSLKPFSKATLGALTSAHKPTETMSTDPSFAFICATFSRTTTVPCTPDPN